MSDRRLEAIAPRWPRRFFWSWNQEKAERLVELWAQGWSSRLIAAELGVTKNAVIGQVHRMLLPKRKLGTIKSATSQPRKLRRTTINHLHLVHRKPPVPYPPTTVEVQDFNNAIPMQQRLGLHELRRHHCRYPVGAVGEANFFFCGAAVERAPYCAFHARVCYREGRNDLHRINR